MKKFLALVALATGLISHAHGQNYPGQMPANTVLGNSTGSPVPFAVPGQIINGQMSNAPASTIKCNATTSSSSPQDCVPISADKTFYVSTSGNDSNSGLDPLFPKLTIQAAVNAAATAGNVIVGSGTYTLSSTLSMQPGVKVSCNPGATITQGNAANLTSLVNFSSNSANKGQILGCIIDGNRTNNTDNANVFCIFGGAANDVVIDGNTVQNCNGYAIDWSTGLRPRVTHNIITNFYIGGISVITGASQTGTSCDFSDNRITGIGSHGVVITNADFCTVRHNIIVGSLTGGVGNTMNVTTSGTSVTWISGPQFTASMAGQFMVINGGMEFFVSTVNSATSLTLATSAGTLTNVPASIGSGDLVDIDSSSFTVVDGNYLTGNVTDGITINSLTGSELAQQNRIINNSLYFIGEIGIGVFNNGGVGLSDNSILGNSLVNMGQSNNTADGGFNYGVFVSGASALKTFIDGNLVRDNQGSPTTGWWLALSSVTAGSVFVGNNVSNGTINNGVTGDVSSITLGAGWGSTATTSAIVSQGNAVQFTITASGAGQAAQAPFTINKSITTPQSPPFIQCKQVSGTGQSQLFFGEQQSTGGVWMANIVGAPIANDTYIVQCKQ